MDSRERLPVLERESLLVADVSVITILWCIEFFNIWISSLCEYTSYVFLTSEQLKSTQFEKNDLAIFIVQCLGALVVAFCVDINRFQKTPVIMIGFALFALTAFVALGTTMSESIWSGMIMFWPCSALFVTLPVTYCLMFNQKLNASFTSVRRLVSVLEMGNALIGWLTFIAMPEDVDRNSRYSVVFMWVVSIPLFVLFLTGLQSIVKYVRGDFTIDKSVVSVVRGIRSDLHHREHTGRSLRHVVFFALLLLPAMSLVILGSALDVSSDDSAQPQDPRLINLLFAFQMLIIPLIEVILAMAHVKEERADYSIILLAHVTNLLVLVLMLTNFKVVPPVSTASDVEPSQLVRIKRGRAMDAKRFSCPEVGKITFLMLNGVKNTVEVVPSVRFTGIPETWTIAAGGYYPAIFPQVDEIMTVDFEIRILDKTLPLPPKTKHNVELRVNTFCLMFIFGNDVFINMKNYTVEHIEKKKKAKVMVFSTLWHDVDGGELAISSDDGSFSKKGTAPRNYVMDYKFFPVLRRLDFTYEYKGTDEQAKKLFNKDTVQVHLEEFDDYIVYVGITDDSGLSINSLRVCDKYPTTEPPTTTSSTEPTTSSSTTTKRPTRRPIPAQELTAYALAGSSLGVTSVAYTHFFWVESPLRLRATMFAMFRVADAVVYRLTPVVTGKELTLTKVYALIALQVTTTIAHLVLGWIFQSYISHD